MIVLLVLFVPRILQGGIGYAATLLHACDDVGALRWGSYQGANRLEPDGLGLLYSAECVDPQGMTYRVDGFSMIYQFGIPETANKSVTPVHGGPGGPAPPSLVMPMARPAGRITPIVSSMGTCTILRSPGSK